MRNVVIILFFVFYGSTALAAEPDSVKTTLHDRWFATDKAHHFLVSAFLTSTLNYIAREEAGYSPRTGKSVAIGITFTIGLGKEIHDKTIGEKHFSYKDMLADCAGIITGLLIYNATE